jgi:hypothetical protein
MPRAFSIGTLIGSAPVEGGKAKKRYENYKGKEIAMNNTLSGSELVTRWRNEVEDDNPAGPLFASGKFAEGDIVYSCECATTHCSSCSGSFGHPCC